MQLTITCLALFLFLNISFSQNCNCKDEFAWLKETMEKNDAGFQYAIDKKGKEAYSLLNENWVDCVSDILSL